MADKLLAIEEVVAVNTGGRCNRQRVGFCCAHLERKQSCTCDLESVMRSFGKLEDKGIIKNAVEYWKWWR